MKKEDDAEGLLAEEKNERVGKGKREKKGSGESL